MLRNRQKISLTDIGGLQPTNPAGARSSNIFCATGPVASLVKCSWSRMKVKLVSHQRLAPGDERELDATRAGGSIVPAIHDSTDCLSSPS